MLQSLNNQDVLQTLVHHYHQNPKGINHPKIKMISLFSHWPPCNWGWSYPYDSYFIFQFWKSCNSLLSAKDWNVSIFKLKSTLAHLNTLMREVAMSDSWTHCSFESNLFNEPLNKNDSKVIWTTSMMVPYCQCIFKAWKTCKESYFLFYRRKPYRLLVYEISKWPNYFFRWTILLIEPPDDGCFNQ